MKALRHQEEHPQKTQVCREDLCPYAVMWQEIPHIVISQVNDGNFMKFGLGLALYVFKHFGFV